MPRQPRQKHKIVFFPSLATLESDKSCRSCGPKKYFVDFRFQTVIFQLKCARFCFENCHHVSNNQSHPLHTAKTKCRKFETIIPRKGILGPQSQFPHSCVCERIIYYHDGSAFSAGGNMWTDPGNI